MKRRGLGENSLLAFVGDGASKASALVVVIVAARFLSVQEFALLAAALAAGGVLGSFLDLGSATLLSRDGAADRTRRGALFTALLRARAPLALIVVVGALLVGLAIGRPWTALAVTAYGIAGALALSVLGLYRSCQDIRPEALQRIASAVLSVAAAVLVSLFLARADALLAALAAITLLTLVPLVRLAPTVADLGARVPSGAALRSAAPIGLLALATVAYYRSGTLVLAALSDAHATAVFGVAAGVAFGTLMIPNAITTALLPRLAAEADLRARIACARRALAWTFVVAVLLSIAAALVVPVVLPILVGPTYADAGAPFAVLCIGIPLIACSGLIGTTLLSVGRLRPLGLQVALSLAVNLAVLVALVPALGAMGAALATVACELAGLLFLAHAARTALPGFLSLHPEASYPRASAPSGATT